MAVSYVEVAHTVASRVPFGEICQLFERVAKAKGTSQKKDELVKFVKKWKELHDKLHAELIHGGSLPKDSFFSAMRLLLPQLDRSRPAFGVKEVLLAKLYIEVLGLSRTNPDAKKLLEFKNPKTNKSMTGDFAEIAYLHILSKRCKTEGSLTIDGVNRCLDKLAQFNTEKKKDQVRKTLFDMIKKTSAMEQKWLIRIILQNVKIHVGHGVIFNAFHPDAEELFNVTTSLEQVCLKLHDTSVRISDAEVKLFDPFRPMLALNAQLGDVDNIMGGKAYRVELKYDGERSQLHKNKVEYKYFSRNGREYSDVFGNSPYCGSLTQHIHSAFDMSVDSCVLDGEMMGYDPESGLFMQKGGRFDIKHITDESELQPCFVAFDVLYLNGENLTSKPLYERIQLLKSVFKPVEGRIVLPEEKDISTTAQLLQCLNDAIDRREEGIIVKHPASTYSPNKRKGSGWFKIKPEYVGGVADDLDLVIVGGKFGSGRHASLINKFMLGVRDGDGPTAKYKSFSMVGSGYTNKELLAITDKLKPHLKIFKKKSTDWLVISKEKPEVVVHPSNSVVVQVRASEITDSTAYATGCTLRFPRIVCTREDKKVEDAIDISQLRTLQSMAAGKLAYRHATVANTSIPKQHKIKVEASAVVSSKFLGVDLTSVEQTSNFLNGYEFCVFSGDAEYTKQNLEKELAACGAEILQNPTSGTHCILAKDSKNIRVRNIILSGNYDVVKISWITKCFKLQRLVPYCMDDMIFTSPKTATVLSSKFDKFGDDYTGYLNENQLRILFENIERDEDFQKQRRVRDQSNALLAYQSNVNDISHRYHSHGFHEMRTSIFNGLFFYVNDKLTVNDSTTRLCSPRWLEIRALILMHSGMLHDHITSNTTHVVYAGDNIQLGDLSVVVAIRSNSDVKFHTVSDDWIHHCIERNRLEPERLYAC